MSIKLPTLPFAQNALEPYLSEEAVHYHYDKHHRNYVDRLNKLTEHTKFAGKSLEQIVADAGDGPIFNNAAQVWNHNFFWKCLSPDTDQTPRGSLADAIDSSFGSFDVFRREFTRAAVDLFGVGWVWLVNVGDGVVSIITTKDAYNPLSHGRIALLGCDLWEHAYYLDYRHERAKYMDAFWHIANFRFAEHRFHTT